MTRNTSFSDKIVNHRQESWKIPLRSSSLSVALDKIAGDVIAPDNTVLI